MAAQLNQAKAQTESARGHLQTQVATLRANQDMLDKTIAIAPFNGIVTNMPVKEGETVVTGIQNTAGSTLMTLADMSVITAEVKVDETDIVNVKIGQPADVTVDAIPNKVFKGHVTLVGDQALLRSSGVATSEVDHRAPKRPRTLRSVVTLDQPSDELRPGLSTTAKITTAHKNGVLSLPIQALTMHRPRAAASNAGKGGGRIDPAARSKARSRTAGRVRGGEGRPRKAARQIYPRYHRHHRRATDIEVLTGSNEGSEVVTGPYKTLRGLKDGSLIKRDTAKPGDYDGHGESFVAHQNEQEPRRHSGAGSGSCAKGLPEARRDRCNAAHPNISRHAEDQRNTWVWLWTASLLRTQPYPRRRPRAT